MTEQEQRQAVSKYLSIFDVEYSYKEKEVGQTGVFVEYPIIDVEIEISTVLKKYVSQRAANLFGLLRSAAQSFECKNLKQQDIEDILQIEIASQSKITKLLEELYLITVHRTANNTIVCYEIHEINYQYFRYYPVIYNNTIYEEKMKHLDISLYHLDEIPINIEILQCCFATDKTEKILDMVTIEKRLDKIFMPR